MSQIASENEAMLKIALLLMSVDGEIKNAELEKFHLIAKQVGVESIADFEEHLNLCRRLIEESNGDLSVLFEKIRKCADDITNDTSIIFIFTRPFNTSEKFKNALYQWVIIANCDGVYSQNEHDLLKYLCEKNDIELSILEEFVDCASTLFDIENQKNFFQTNSTDSPSENYKVIIEELERSSKDIYLSINELINIG